MYSITFCVLYLLPTVVQSCTDLEYPSNPGCIPTDPNQTPAPNCDTRMNDMETQSPGMIVDELSDANRNRIGSACFLVGIITIVVLLEYT